jgi:hypothetical protein
MKKFFCLSVCTLLLASTVAFADPVTKVVFEVQESGVHADFTAAVPPSITNCGTLDWTGGTIAKVYTTTGTNIYYPTVDAAFINGNDTSSGGLASAVFGDMSFTVWLYTTPLRTTLLGSITGTLYNNSFDYVEQEISLSGGSVLDGAAVIKLTSFNVSGYSWIEAIGERTGMRSETSLTSDIANYQSNWHSTNTVITVLADESGIPEPATIGLLTLGGLLLRRKK